MKVQKYSEKIIKESDMPKKRRNLTKCGCDLEAMIRAFQALCPGSIPGVRIPIHAGVAKHGQRRRT